ncbi:MAG: hypothetical protein ACRDWT_05400 [Jatrophihabitantaceae bacterium]
MRSGASRIAAVAAVAIALSRGPLLIGPPASATPDQNCTPQAGGTLNTEPWAQKWLGFDRVWPITQGGGVRVAVIDTCCA